MTVQDAIKRIRRTGEDSELIYTCYVIDDRRLLEGVVTVKDLLLAQDDETIGAADGARRDHRPRRPRTGRRPSSG